MVREISTCGKNNRARFGSCETRTPAPLAFSEVKEPHWVASPSCCIIIDAPTGLWLLAYRASVETIGCILTKMLVSLGTWRSCFQFSFQRPLGRRCELRISLAEMS